MREPINLGATNSLRVGILGFIGGSEGAWGRSDLSEWQWQVFACIRLCPKMPREVGRRTEWWDFVQTGIYSK